MIRSGFTENEVTPKSSYDCGLAFGDFQAQLSDLQEPLGETIPNFHNMEYRLAQLSQASDSNISGRLKQVAPAGCDSGVCRGDVSCGAAIPERHIT